MASSSIVLITSVVVFVLMSGLTTCYKRSYDSSDIYQLDDDCDDCGIAFDSSVIYLPSLQS